MKKHIYKFLIKWLVSALGLWIASALLKHNFASGNAADVIIFAGLILAIINTFLKPILIVLALPAVVLSLGLFMIVINGFTVFLVSRLYPSLMISNFWQALFAGIVIGLVNYLVTTVLDNRIK